MAEGPAPRESAPSEGCLNVKQLGCTLGTLDLEYSWEQLSELEKHFKMEPHPDLEAQRVLAMRLSLTEEQVKTWFTQRSMKPEKGLFSAWLLWKPVRRHNPYSCASNKAGGCLSPSCQCRPVNSRERFRQNFQRYLKLMQSYHTRRRQLRQGLYKSRESAWCRMLPRTVKPHISHASCQGKESSQNSAGLPETLEALKKLRLSSGYPNTDDF
ncbi:homeobox protein unc-4 homolog [Chionomys nivalis]|uniref:homeobox protein unc-4 homolog n=1 Tax=Chionomys nivalis TaxID=269649 RepID=UPI002593AE0F|nr:homeobox protein unc-4 homolog [Chionomys nivalis]